jgi:hypothetical protein
VFIDSGREPRAPALAEGVRPNDVFNKKLIDHVNQALDKLAIKDRVSILKAYSFRSVKKRQGQADLPLTNIVVTLASPAEAKLVVDTANRAHRAAVQAAQRENHGGAQSETVHTP